MPDAALALLPLVAVALAFGARPVVGALVCAAVIAVAELPEGYLNPFIVVLVAGPWLVGWLLRSRWHLLTQLQARGEEVAAEQKTFAAESVRYERARIARELHDIVAHCMSVVVVQAAAARRVADPDLTAGALNAITATAAEAGEEVNRLIKLLHPAEPRVDAGLAVVTELVARARATGLSVSASITNVDETVSPPIADTVHRVVQEAITNALKHAPGAPIRITIDSGERTLHATIINDPAPADLSALHTIGGSNGLTGMRDRVARYGGTLDAGTTPDGGWRVAATLPRIGQ